MDQAELEKKAQNLYAAAVTPKLADILYRESICAVWDHKLQTFSAVKINGIFADEQVPTRSRTFSLVFLPQDSTDMEAITQRVNLRRTGVRRMLNRKQP